MALRRLLIAAKGCRGTPGKRQKRLILARQGRSSYLMYSICVRSKRNPSCWKRRSGADVSMFWINTWFPKPHLSAEAWCKFGWSLTVLLWDDDQRVKDKHASSYRIHHQDPFCSLALLRRQVPAEIEAWPEALVCGTLDGFAPTGWLL